MRHCHSVWLETVTLDHDQRTVKVYATHFRPQTNQRAMRDQALVLTSLRSTLVGACSARRRKSTDEVSGV